MCERDKKDSREDDFQKWANNWPPAFHHSEASLRERYREVCEEGELYESVGGDWPTHD